MNINALKLRVRAIKRRYINLFIVVFFILLFPFDILATYIPELERTKNLIEDFESYELGAVQEPDFTPGAYPCYIATIGGSKGLTNESLISNQAYTCLYNYKFLFDKEESNLISFDYYLGRNRNGWYNDFFAIRAYDVNDNDLGLLVYTTLSISPNRYYFRTAVPTLIYTSYPNRLDHFTIEVDPTTDKIRFNVNNINAGAWFDWTSFYSSISSQNIAYLKLYFEVRGGYYTGTGSSQVRGYFDNIYYVSSPEWPSWSWDYDIGIEITAPEVGSMTELPNGTTTTTGNWEVKEFSNLYWDNIHAVLKNLATLKSTLFSQAIEGTPGSSGSFSIDIEDLEDGNYQLCWSATGTRIPYATRWAYFYCEEDEKTILRIGDFPELPRYILLEEFEACNFENCAEYDLLEKLVCEIKNFGLSLICPDPEKLLDLNIAINEIKNKFPFAYIRLARTEYNFLREQVEDKNDFEITILGNTSNVEVNFFNSIEDKNGNSLMDYLKWFFNGLIILSFVLYGLYFMKRIF